jgi:hypothetical protein
MPMSSQSKKRKFNELEMSENNYAPRPLMKRMKRNPLEPIKEAPVPELELIQDGEKQEVEMFDAREIVPYNQILPYSAYQHKLKEIFPPIYQYEEYSVPIVELSQLSLDHSECP